MAFISRPPTYIDIEHKKLILTHGQEVKPCKSNKTNTISVKKKKLGQVREIV